MAKSSTVQPEPLSGLFSAPEPYPEDTLVSAPDAEVFPLDVLAEKHGQKIKGIVPDCDPYKPDHMMASLLNGWLPHSHNYGVVTLSDDDYIAALAAAKAGNSYGPANKRPLK